MKSYSKEVVEALAEFDGTVTVLDNGQRKAGCISVLGSNGIQAEMGIYPGHRRWVKDPTDPKGERLIDEGDDLMLLVHFMVEVGGTVHHADQVADPILRKCSCRQKPVGYIGMLATTEQLVPVRDLETGEVLLDEDENEMWVDTRPTPEAVADFILTMFQEPETLGLGKVVADQGMVQLTNPDINSMTHHESRPDNERWINVQRKGKIVKIALPKIEFRRR
jgi:hypothetical protein